MCRFYNGCKNVMSVLQTLCKSREVLWRPWQLLKGVWGRKLEPNVFEWHGWFMDGYSTVWRSWPDRRIIKSFSLAYSYSLSINSQLNFLFLKYLFLNIINSTYSLSSLLSWTGTWSPFSTSLSYSWNSSSSSSFPSSSES